MSPHTKACAFRQMSEGHLLEKIRQDLAAAETALAAERANVLSICEAGVARERELKGQLSVAAAELTAAQQAADERATALATAEERVSIMDRELEAQMAQVATLHERLRR